MDFQRVRIWDWLAALAGVILFIDLFLPWYGVVGLTANAWVAFTFVDLLLALAALTAIALPFVAASQHAFRPVQLWATAVFWLGVAAAVFAVLRLINVPGVDTILAGGAADITRKAGAFIGALVAIALAVVAYRARRDRAAFPGPLREQSTDVR